MNEDANILFTAAPSVSLNSFYRLLGSTPAVESQTEDGLFYWCTKMSHPWFNGLLAARKPGGDEAKNIRKMVSFFAERKVKDFTFWLDNFDWAEEWAAHLVPAGFELSQGPPGMSANLAELPGSAATPDGFRIETVRDFEVLRTWMEVFVPGFGLPDEFVDSYYKVMRGMGTGLPIRSYLGFLKDEPVCTSTLFLSDGIAGIYNVATLEKARGQGLGAAITRKPLQEAREMGYEIAALQASEMGFRIYQRLGFEKVSDIQHFYHSDS